MEVFMEEKNMVLSSTDPITDRGRKFNFIYWIGGIAGFWIGLFWRSLIFRQGY